MTINKFQGKTKEEAIEKAKAEFGENAVIMNVREIKPKGFLGIFKSSTFEVTAAMQEKDVFPSISRKTVSRVPDKINYAADEEIKLPPYSDSKEAFGDISREIEKIEKREKKESSENKIEERLNNLSNILEEKLGKPKEEEVLPVPKESSGEELKFVRILYNTLISNEVNEKYVNQILEEIERFLRPGNSVDTILSNIYQKLILRFGQPKGISVAGAKPKVIFFIGPTGVGKTTTIVKIASKYKVEMEKKVAFITADTYRIAATEQLKIYANILDAPMSIVYSVDDINNAIAQMLDYDLIFVDTAGFSHKNEEQKAETKSLLDGVDSVYEKEVFLVVSATTKYNDLLDIVDMYKEISSFKLIFTKLDETSTFGNLLNIKLYSGAELSYATNGQNVPDDIEIFNTQKIVKQLLGGNKHGSGRTIT
ncbi:MAG: flagellar biosynthesis protein FlhF [Agathobacter sp.]|nr:flagellar biosynthesis protein FlhF [Agathobacter sp.]